tara:strand:+ start:3487 stop:3954 length:468 start_codon:yes stop_codon:yes gene_type:complete
MLNEKAEVIKEIFEDHGDDAVYITNTGFLSRDVYSLFSENKNIFYMQGSMGLSPSIALGIAKNTNKEVVALVGDASLLMHLGTTHTIRDEDLNNLFVYVLDNGCHESVGAYPCSQLEDSYPGVDKIYKIKNSTKNARVGISFDDNAKQIKDFLHV